LKKALITFLKIFIFFFGWAALSGIINIPNENPAIWRFTAELIPFAVMVVFTVGFLIIERSKVKIPVTENGINGTIVGILAGIVWIGLSAIILLISKQLEIVEKNDVPMLWLWMLSAFINVTMQELLIRGYLYQLLKIKYNLPLAIVVTTIIFTLLHGGAFEAGLLPVVNVITMCLFMTALYESERTIIAPIMAHAIWNVIGAIVLGGVSLADDYPSLYSMVALGNKLLSGGDYKIEGSIVVSIINIVLMLLFCTRYKRRQAKER